MTDTDLLSRLLAVLDPGTVVLHGLRRGGRLLLMMPAAREAAARTLRLYQPQRRLARWMVTALQWQMRFGLHVWLLPKVKVSGTAAAVIPPLDGIEPGTLGVLLGSPEHRVRRAIASYRNAGAWEVAKVSFGPAGARVLEDEAQALVELQALAAGVPRLLGLHRGDEVTVLRMPYLTGKPLHHGESNHALDLLDSWVSDVKPKTIMEFSEWPAIESALVGSEAGREALRRLSREHLRPVICHGDFARWNLLKQEDGRLVVLDWEWGHKDGMPGIDLVHYFLQDARLVERLTPHEAIAATVRELRRPQCRNYLDRCGWSGDPVWPILACLAYKQGAGHQENREMLEEILNAG